MCGRDADYPVGFTGTMRHVSVVRIGFSYPYERGKHGRNLDCFSKCKPHKIFFQANASAPLEEFNDMVNKAARLRRVETESDKVGPTSATKSMHNVGVPTPNKTYEPAQTPDAHQTELFGRDIAAFLLRAHQEGRFQRLCLVVSPQFLGMLRELLDLKLKAVVNLELNKDYTHFGPEQLREQIQAHKANG